MFKRADFREYVTHFCMFYLHVLLIIPKVSFFSYPRRGCVTLIFVHVGPRVLTPANVRKHYKLRLKTNWLSFY